MCSILMSINPEHVNNILLGKKKYEFRKRACRRKVDKIIIYSTTPVMKIVGEAEIEDILIDSPKKIWNITKNSSGINKKFFDAYYHNRKEAVAYKLKNVVRYETPRELSELGVKTAPQSYQYIEDSILQILQVHVTN